MEPVLFPYRLARRVLCCLALTASAQTLADQASTGQDRDASDPVSSEGSSESEASEIGTLDWVPFEELTEAQRQALPTGCCGAYISPPRTDEDAGKDPEQSPVRASADRSEMRDQTFVVLEGDVRLTQGYRSFDAEAASLDQQSRQADMSGDITIREPGLLLRAEQAEMDMDSGDAQLEDARFVIHETRVRGRAEHLEKLGDRFIGLERSSLTTCEPDSNAWQLRANKINIYNNEHYGTARHMRMELFHVPVFYTPYLRFPLGDHRQTGFLFPSLGESRRNGVEVTLPFYWNIAPNLDATITPDYMSKRGTSWNLETRHLSRHFQTMIGGAYLDEDRGGYSRRLERQIRDGEITEEEAYPHRGDERWQLRVQQEGGEGQRWTTEIDYTDLSDNDYLRDLNSSGLDVNRTAQVSKMGRASYQGDNWLFGVKAEELRALSTAKWPHRELPRVNADGLYQWSDWVLGLKNEYTYFDVNDTFETEDENAIDNLLVGERFRTDYSLTWDKEWLWGFFRPGASVKTLSYQLKEDNLVEDANASPSLAVPQGTLDMGLYFERDGQLFGKGFLQTLEPRIFYFYSDFEDHSDLFGLTENNRPLNFDAKPLTFNYSQLYRTSRFSGGDRIEDANQVSVGVTSRFIDPLTGTENLSVSAGQIFYFADRRVGLTTPDFEYDPEENPDAEQPEETYERSELAGQLSARLGQRVNFTSNVAYNQVEDRLESGNASLRYADDSDRILNLSYRYTHNPPSPGQENPEEEMERAIDQVDFSFHVPVPGVGSGQWSLIGRANYDFTYEKELDTFVGLEYNDCCYRVRLMARRWLDFDYTPTFLETVENDDYDQSIVFDFQFKGLGSINRKVGELLEKAIPGYGVRDGSIR